MLHRQGLLSARGFLHLVDFGAEEGAQRRSDAVPAILYPSIDTRSVSVPMLDGFSVDDLSEDTELIFTPDDSLTEQSFIYSSRRLFPQQ